MKLHKLGSHPRYSTLEEGTCSAKVGKFVYMHANNQGNNWIKQIYMHLNNAVSNKNRLT